MGPKVTNFRSSETRLAARKTFGNGRKWPNPTKPDRAEKRPPPEVDRAEVERDVEAKRQARKQREQDAAAAAAAAKRPVGRPKGSGTKPGPALPGPAAAAAPQQLVWVCDLGRAGTSRWTSASPHPSPNEI